MNKMWNIEYIPNIILFPILLTIFILFFILHFIGLTAYTLPFILLTIVVCIYFTTRKKIKKNFISDFEIQRTSYSKLYEINIFYVILFTNSIFLLVKSYNMRSVYYFLIIIAIVGLLTLEILYMPVKGKYELIVLAKIGLVASNLRLGIQYIFPNSFVLYDPYVHKQIIESILLTGYVPQKIAYSSTPFFHILLTCESIFSGLNNFIYIFCINFVLKSLLIIILLYLIGWKLFDSKKMGLISSLLYAVLDRSIMYDVSFSPTSLAILLVTFTIYIIFKREHSNNKLSLTVVLLVFMLTLILTHSLTSVLLCILLAIMWLSSNIFKEADEEKCSLKSIKLLTLFLTSMFAHWMYASGYYFGQLTNIIKWGFETDKIAPYMLSDTTSSTLNQTSLVEHFLSYFGYYLFVTMSILGFLYSISGKNTNKKQLMFLSISPMVTIMITFISIVMNIYFIPDRWWYYSEHMTIIMTFGLILFAYGTVIKNKKIGSFIIIFLVIIISFFNITNPIANIDTPLYSENISVRHASLTSEAQSISTISQRYNGKILVDIQAANNVCNSDADNIEVITSQLISSKKYLNFEGLIILRKYVLDLKPFDARGLYKLDHNPLTNLDKEKYKKVYDSNIVYAYTKT